MKTPVPGIVLNVDDEPAPRYVKTRALEAGGFQVLEATSGAEALRLIEQLHPPVVLLDVQLPDINGYEVCAFIKNKWPEVMVLLTSATFTESAHRTKGLDSGADSFLVQPAEALELAAAVKALLRIRRSEDELRQLNATLEQRVNDRVSDLAAANARLMAEMAQRQKAEAALVQAQKMEAIGQLTGGIAHDFNNLLTAVVGSLELIKTRAADPRTIRLADNAFKAAERGSKLTAQLLAFSRTQKLLTAPVDVNALIDGMRELLAQSLGANIIVEIVLEPNLPAAMADLNQLELAVLNLSINARDAMPDGGSLRITTSLDPRNREHVVISVTDTGAGMPPEVLARAFDPFFTTKPPGKGTGLGLSQVYGIVRQIGGDVTIETEVGKGTRVRLTLPRASTEALSRIALEPKAALGRSEKVLIVDDDSDVREIMKNVLVDAGYVVIEAHDGESALAILSDSSPDLLVVDFAMPGMNGAELVRAAHVRDPGLCVLFVSGYSDSSVLESLTDHARLLRKPFRPTELAAAVRQALTV